MPLNGALPFKGNDELMNVLITGAAGNLGSLLARYIKANEKDLNLILMQHKKEVPGDLGGAFKNHGERRGSFKT